ncbi:MAG: hypothetical protein Q4A05_10250 [Ruminococcus sp.]|nr:hypothetical protein [Ruminococcus sp.]
MLSKPVHGWSTFSIRDFKAHVSDLVDIPFDWLHACKNGLENRIPIALYIDEEGKEDYIIAHISETYIITEDEDMLLKYFNNIGMYDITYMLIDDIKAFFDDWVHFIPYQVSDEDLTKRSNDLKKLLQETEEQFQICLKNRKISIDEIKNKLEYKTIPKQ